MRMLERGWLDRGWGINRVDARRWFLWKSVFGPIFFYSRLYFLTILALFVSVIGDCIIIEIFVFTYVFI